MVNRVVARPVRQPSRVVPKVVTHEIIIGKWFNFMGVISPLRTTSKEVAVPIDPILSSAERELNFTDNWNKRTGGLESCHLGHAQVAALVKELDRLKKELVDCKQCIEDVAIG